jgi:hypothetical protein
MRTSAIRRRRAPDWASCSSAWRWRFFAAVLAGVGWLITDLIRGIRDDVAEVKADHRTNGGSTSRDALDRIEAKVDRFGETVTNHLAAHVEGQAA